jgi:hypothetical protein
MERPVSDGTRAFVRTQLPFKQVPLKRKRVTQRQTTLAQAFHGKEKEKDDFISCDKYQVKVA